VCYTSFINKMNIELISKFGAIVIFLFINWSNISMKLSEQHHENLRIKTILFKKNIKDIVFSRKTLTYCARLLDYRKLTTALRYIRDIGIVEPFLAIIKFIDLHLNYNSLQKMVELHFLYLHLS
jgi:hypothetical protein